MINKELTQIRESLSLSKKEFAEKIGTTAMMVGRYEKGSSKIPEEIATVAKALVEPAVPTEEDIASLIKGVRESLSLSKSAFARLIGVSATAAGNYESGKNRPKDEILEKIKGLRDEKSVKKMLDRLAEETESADGIMPFPVNESDAEETSSAEKKPENILAVASVPVAAPSVVIESQMGGSITVDEILSRLPENVEAVYVKPEENKAYWVKGDESGAVELW